MKELRHVMEWIATLGQPEPQTESIREWIDREDALATLRAGRIAAEILVGLLLMLAVLGASSILILSVPFGLRVALSAVAGIGGAFGIFCWVWIGRRIRRALPGRREDAEVRAAIASLRNTRGSTRLRVAYGDHGVSDLNEGAQLLLRCRSALRSEAWHGTDATGEWAEARTSLLNSMELAMDRLVLHVVRGRPYADVIPILDEMRAGANEAVRATERRSTFMGSTGKDLRASISRMRELAEAEQELIENRDRPY